MRTNYLRGGVRVAGGLGDAAEDSTMAEMRASRRAAAAAPQQPGRASRTSP